MSDIRRDTFEMPPVLYNQNGDVRKVGFELEFVGDNLEAFAHSVARWYGGTIHEKNPFAYTLSGTDFGDFDLELDAKIFHDRLYRKVLDQIGLELDAKHQESLEKALLGLTSGIIPFELTSPPIPMTELERVHDLEKALRESNALGTGASVLYAFGMHINPEVPDLSAKTIHNFLKAFLLLLDWLKQDIRVDLSRKIVPFINDFPKKYVDLVLDPNYAPDYDRLVDDYLEYNNTRNRALDLTALFAHVDSDTLDRVKDAFLVKPRPTFHYRLANCSIDEADWSMAAEWNRWIKVEELAHDESTLSRLQYEYMDKKDSLDEWIKKLTDFVGL